MARACWKRVFLEAEDGMRDNGVTGVQTCALPVSPKPVIAMIRVGALPGTAASRATLRELEEQAVAECAIYREAGVHGVMLENMHDVPYLRGGEIGRASSRERV